MHFCICGSSFKYIYQSEPLMSVDTVSYQGLYQNIISDPFGRFYNAELSILVLQIKIKEIAIHRAEVVLIEVGKTIIKVSYQLT